ncbi:MAG: nitroreductase [Paracoccaceae bacterium]
MRSEFKDLLARRRSIRAFTGDRVDRATLERILMAARQAPSGANLQPGKFHVLTGPALNRLKARLTLAMERDEPMGSEYSYFPDKMSAELKERQRRAGFALYEALGIQRRDVEGRRAQFAKNYAFFDAPVGIIATIDRDMGKGCFMDLGMSIMALLLSVEAEDLGATGIGALANYGAIVHAHLGLPAGEMVVCGIALGVPDHKARVNQFRTERQELADFTTFAGFDDEDPAAS